MQILRELIASDAPALFAIDSAAAPYPWTLRQFSEGLAGDEFGWGIEVDDHLVGFALFQCVLDEATLMNIAVDPTFQRRGLAHTLLKETLAYLRQRDMTRCLLEVRAANRVAIALYERLGFHIDGRRRNYYPVANDTREDAVLMSRNLSSPKPS